MHNYKKFSVIITTYDKERLDNFKEAIYSIINQTKKPDEIVVVFDSEIEGIKKQYFFLKQIVKKNADINFKIIKLGQNVGRGKARNIAVKNASHDLIAIMDSDDISLPNRFEKELNIFNTYSNVDIVGSWQEEFIEGTNSTFIKKCPMLDCEIKKSLKFRCLLPNPSIMLKKKKFLMVGGYDEDLSIGEDHILFVKLAIQGANFYCIQEPLIKVRINKAQRKRRSGLTAIKNDYMLRKKLYKLNYITHYEFVISSLMFFFFRLAPIKVKNILYKLVRDKVREI